ncbi:MAG: ISNCY family transposase, partial [Acidobacteriota bacterium]
AQKKLEKGERIRIDSTASETDIHHPTDSTLLYDSVRTITRLLKQLKERTVERESKKQPGWTILFSDHTRRAKRRAYQIAQGRGKKREERYRDLLKISRKTYGYAQAALQGSLTGGDGQSLALWIALENYGKLMARVIDQTERRVLRGEEVPAEEKVVSIFEEHTDIIKKGGRETVFGHKLFLNCGRSGMMTHCVIERGNPGDAPQLQPLLQAHRDLYGSYPRQIAADRGFYSGANLKWAKGEGIEDAALARKGSVKISDLVRSSWIYKQLTRFRAGIEGCISHLKRVFGLDRCTWKGWEHFKQYVRASVVAYNLLVLARLLL